MREIILASQVPSSPGFIEGRSARGAPLFIHSPQHKRFCVQKKINTHFVDLSSVDNSSYLAKYDDSVVSNP